MRAAKKETSLHSDRAPTWQQHWARKNNAAVRQRRDELQANGDVGVHMWKKAIAELTSALGEEEKRTAIRDFERTKDAPLDLEFQKKCEDFSNLH